MNTSRRGAAPMVPSAAPALVLAASGPRRRWSSPPLVLAASGPRRLWSSPPPTPYGTIGIVNPSTSHPAPFSQPARERAGLVVRLFGWGMAIVCWVSLWASPAAAADGPAVGAQGGGRPRAAANDRGSSERPPWLPDSWQIGAAVDGDTITAIESHPEFVRIVAGPGSFELVQCNDNADRRWCSLALRIQPAPQASADPAKLRRRLAELDAVGDRRTAPALQARPIGDVRTRLAARDAHDAVWSLALLQAWGLRVLALLIALALALRLANGDMTRRVIAFAVAALAAALPIMGRTAWGADSINIEHANLLHEGWSLYLVDTLTSRWQPEDPARLLLGPGEGLQGVVAANQLLQWLAAALLFGVLHACGATLRRALALTAMVCLSVIAWNTGHSETEGSLSQVVCLLGAVGVAAALDRTLARPWRFLGIGLVVLLSSFLERRLEVRGAAAVAVAVSLWAMQPASWRRLWDRPLALASRLLVWVPWPLWVGVILLGALLRPEDGDVVAHAVFGAWPLRPAVLRLPLELAIGAPLLLSVLVIAGGLGLALRADERRHGWIGVMALSQFGSYLVVGHGDLYELQRYLATLLPALSFVALVGWRTLDAATEGWRGSNPHHRRLWWAGLALLACTDGRIGDAERKFGSWPAREPMRRNPQLEARFLVRALQAEPECVFVTRTGRDADRDGRIVGHGLVVFGVGYGGSREVDATPEALHGAFAELDSEPPCLRAFVGLDCALLGMPSCEPLGRDDPRQSLALISAPSRASHFGRLDRARFSFEIRDLAPPWRPPASR